MEEVVLGSGEVSVKPLAFESFGVRGMATFVETGDTGILIDPGSALGPRFNLMPHEREYMALAESRRRIIDAARDADLITVSHYHFDHYVPGFEEWTWIWSSPDLAERIYRGKLLLMKDTRSDINTSQRKRGFMFQKFVSNIAREVEPADGREFRFGKTIVRFSSPAFHGPQNSPLGQVLMVSVRCGDVAFVHASDVQGPMDAGALEFILREKPEMAVVGGPPLYLKGYRVEDRELETALGNMLVLARNVPVLVVDHHLLRTAEYSKYLTPVVEEAGARGNRVLAASELLGKAPVLLEAMRKELYEEEPVGKEERLESLKEKLLE